MVQNTSVSPALKLLNANGRETSEFAIAHRHSTIVNILKKVLPICAFAIVCLFFLLATTARIPLANISVDQIGLKQGNLVMEKPKMAGFDENSRPYDVKAFQAIQNLAQPGKVMLKSIAARLPMDTTSFANIDAKSGVYDAGSEKLSLSEEVSIKGARGMDLMLMDADIDIKSGTMESTNPVKVSSGSTNITADSVRVEQSGKRIIFTNRVRMIINRPMERGTKQAKDGS